MSKVIIIDDTDPTIIYTGSWTSGGLIGNNTNEYDSTVHRSGTPGDKMSYTFYGDHISVYGTLEKPSTNGSPSASFSIDGSTPTAFNKTGSVIVPNPTLDTAHILLYQSPVLTKDTHTLSIEMGSGAKNTARLNVDYLTVSGSESPAGNLIIDDRDPSILYTGAWHTSGQADEYMVTTTKAPTVATGGSATMHFNATSISVFGTTSATKASNTTSKVVFSIDGVPSETYTGAQNMPVIRNKRFFHVDGLSSTQEHTLTLSTMNANGWYLDYLVIHVEDSPTPSSSGTTTQQPSQSGTIVLSTQSETIQLPSQSGTAEQASQSNSETSTSIAVGQTDSKHTSNIGVIAGAVVGSAIGALILVIIFMLLRRRRNAKRIIGENNMYGESKSATSLVPLNLAAKSGAPSSYFGGGSSGYGGKHLLDVASSDSSSNTGQPLGIDDPFHVSSGSSYSQSGAHNQARRASTRSYPVSARHPSSIISQESGYYQNEKSRFRVQNLSVPVQDTPNQTPLPSPSITVTPIPELDPPPQVVSTPRREVDGGVRLQSGDSEEDHESILPPSYARY